MKYKVQINSEAIVISDTVFITIKWRGEIWILKSSST